MVTKRDKRNANGTFAKGHSGGPGRPRRSVEREYLLCLAESVTLDDWKAVVDRAVVDAKRGDARARDWLARFLVGGCPTLSALELQEKVEDPLEGLRIVDRLPPRQGPI